MRSHWSEYYYLEPQPKGSRKPGLRIILRPDFWAGVQRYLRQLRSETRSAIEQRTGLKYAEPDTKKERYTFGFGNLLRAQPAEDGSGWTEVTARFEKKVPPQHTATSLHYLFLPFDIAAEECHQEAPHPAQLMHVEPVQVGGTFHAFPLALYVGHACAQHLDKRPRPVDFPQARELMAAVYRIYGNGFEKAAYMQACIRECGILQFSVGGNCACLGTSPDQRDGDEGYYLSSHNLDTSIQQLVLLAGIAAIWQDVRQSLRSAS